MPRTLQVAWREFKATAMTKAFLLAAVIVPALMVALALLGPLLFNPQPPPLSGTIAIVDPAGHVAKAADHEFSLDNIKARINRMARAKEASPSGMTNPDDVAQEFARNPRSMTAITREFDIKLEFEKHTSMDDIEALKGRVASGDLVALITAETGPPTSAATETPTPAISVPSITARLFVPSNSNIKHTSLIEDLVQDSVARARIEASGLDVPTVRDLASAPEPETIRVGKDAVERAQSKKEKVFKLMVPFVFMMLLWMGAFVSANYLLTTTIEEKSNKVMEVLLSAVSPFQLMAGKIIGQAFVGLVMVGMYMALGIAALLAFAYFDLIDWSDLLWFALYYVMAYFMVASIMAAIGSAVNELREAQSLMTPAMLVLVIPLMLWLPISDSPNGTLANVVSFIPPLIPFVMILRITGGEAIPFWQIPATIVIGYIATLAMIWMSAKIFRVGVLMYGKPPSPLELIKWVRYS